MMVVCIMEWHGMAMAMKCSYRVEDIPFSSFPYISSLRQTLAGTLLSIRQWMMAMGQFLFNIMISFSIRRSGKSK